MKTTIINPNVFQLENNVLRVSNEETKTEVFTFSNISPSQDELIARECSDNYEFFDLAVGPLMKEEIGLNDLQIEIVKNFLEEANYFQ